MTAVMPARMPLGTWTILAEGSEAVLVTVTQERATYCVRDSRGRLVGRFATAQLALASVALPAAS